MYPSKPRFRPANLLLISWIGLLWVATGSGPLTAQAFNFGLSAQTVTTWITGFSHWLKPAAEPTPPESGTCIDPNGKPKPCDPSRTVPARTRREADRPPRV